MLKKMKFFLFLNCLFSNIYSEMSGLDINTLPWINIVVPKRSALAIPFLPENPIIVEVGVDVGLDTVRLKNLWPKSVIYGFEPISSSYNTAMNNTVHLSDIYLNNCALADHEGEITFYLSQRTTSSSSIVPCNIKEIAPSEKLGKETYIPFRDIEIKVPCTTLDRWVIENNIKNIDYLWIDAVGGELSILKGALDILSTVKVLSVECNFAEFRKGATLFPDLYAFLIAQGFTLKYILGNSSWVSVGVFLNTRFEYNNQAIDFQSPFWHTTN